MAGRHPETVRVLITGAAGFIGSNLTRYWLAQHPDDEVVAFDALTYAGRRESLTDCDRNPAFRFVHGDIGHPEDVAAAVQGADLVLHLAAESHNDRAIRDPTQFVRTNVLGTAVLLEACRAADVGRFHHVSTDEVYGSLDLTDPRRFGESSPYQPRGPYSASKAGSDHLVRAWHATYGLRVTLSNCGNNFGPYQFPEKLIPYSVIRLLRGSTIPLYGDGRNVRDWIYVEDHVSAIDRIAHDGRVGATYLVSAENERSNLEIAEKLLAILRLDRDRIEFVADRPGHDRRYALDPTRLKEELGWRPRVDFDRGLERTVDWYQRNRAWWEPILPKGG